MPVKTRKPTGKPPWPILLLAGGEKCGKSYSAAALSSSNLIDRTFWIEIGEGSADQYGALPGARYEIVEHDGTYSSMLAAAKDAVAEPVRGGRPHAIVVDSMTELWDLLCAEQQAEATRRKKDIITMDQWNVAKKRWRAFLDVLRSNKGPVILTARYDQVTVVEKGKPKTSDGTSRGEPVKEWKVRAEKNLTFEVDGIVAIPRPRTFFLNGMRSLKYDVPVGGFLKLPDNFTLDQFLRDLGIDGNAGERTYVAPQEEEQDEHYAPAPDEEREISLDELEGHGGQEAAPSGESDSWPQHRLPGQGSGR